MIDYWVSVVMLVIVVCFDGGGVFIGVGGCELLLFVIEVLVFNFFVSGVVLLECIKIGMIVVIFVRLKYCFWWLVL